MRAIGQLGLLSTWQKLVDLVFGKVECLRQRLQASRNRFVPGRNQLQNRQHQRLVIRNRHQARFSPIEAMPSMDSTLVSICSAFMPATAYMSCGLA